LPKASVVDRVRGLVAITVLVTALLMSPVAAVAAPGALDHTFGVHGTATVQFSGSGISDVDVLADGRIVVGGTSNDGTGHVFTLLRFLSSGQLDPAFGTAGVVRVGFGVNSRVAGVSSVLPLPNGDLVAVGTTDAGVGVLRVDAAGQTVWSRVHELGRPYTDNRGVVDARARADAAALVGDKVVVSGSASRGNGPGTALDPMLARLNASDGSLDLSFGEAGRLIAPRQAGPTSCGMLEGHDAPFTWFVVRADGSIVAGGAANCGGANDHYWLILRAYTSTGEPLPGFQIDPMTVRPLDWLRAGASDIAPMAVSFADGAGSPAALMRLASGAPTDVPLPVLPIGMEAQNDGRVVGLRGGTAMRFLPDRSLDASFGTAGGAPTGIEAPAAVALQPDGKIIVAGERLLGNRSPDNIFTLTRLLGGVKAGLPVIHARRVAVRRRGVSVPISCAGPHGAGSCRGAVRITAAGRRHTSFTRARTFRVTAGKQISLRMALNATARRRIARAPHRRLTVRLAITSPRGTKERRLVLSSR
jgi:uncharacterized delta-60 repeat protein